MTLVRFLHAAAKAMLASAIIVNVLALIGKVAALGNLLTALQHFAGWFNPRNTETFVMEVVLFSPAVFLYLLAEHLEKRR